jgi:hypothetical protein
MSKKITILLCSLLLTTLVYSVNPSHIIKERWRNNAWSVSERYSYTYDANGRVILYQTQNYNSSSSKWIDYSRVTSEYNQDGTLKQTIEEVDFGTGWNNFIRNMYTYTTSGKIKTVTQQAWSGSAWQNTLKMEEYTYDSKDNRIGYLRYSVADTGAITNGERITYYFDSNNKELESMREIWDLKLVDWKKTHLNTNTYNANSQLVETMQKVWTPGWDTASKLVYTYDLNGKVSSMGYVQMSDTGWKNFQEFTTYNYLSDGSMDYYLFKRLNSGTQQLDNDSRYVYYYPQSSEVKTSKLSFGLFPNPVKDILKLSYESASETSMLISDFKGCPVYSTTILVPEINVEDLPAGIYFVTLQSNGKIGRSKFIKR